MKIKATVVIPDMDPEEMRQAMEDTVRHVRLQERIFRMAMRYPHVPPVEVKRLGRLFERNEERMERVLDYHEDWYGSGACAKYLRLRALGLVEQSDALMDEWDARWERIHAEGR